MDQQIDIFQGPSFSNTGNDDRTHLDPPTKENDLGALSTPNSQGGFLFDETNDIDPFLDSFSSSQTAIPVTDNILVCYGSHIRFWLFIDPMIIWMAADPDILQQDHSDLSGLGAFACTSSLTSLASPMTSFDHEDGLQFLLSASPRSFNSSSSTISSWNKPSPAKPAPGDSSSKAGCGCLDAMLLSIANLCDPQKDLAGSRLDTVLQLTQGTSDHISKYLACIQCTKEPTNIAFTAILLQRLVKLFCGVAKNGVFYLASLKLGVGVFELSKEEDARHKKILITSAAKKVNEILIKLGNTARDYYQTQMSKSQLGETMTESGTSNLKWVATTVGNLQSQLKTIVGMVEAHEWGNQHTV